MNKSVGALLAGARIAVQAMPHESFDKTPHFNIVQKHSRVPQASTPTIPAT